MPVAEHPRNLGELRQSGYQALPVREEMRNNLIDKIRAEEIVFPGIIGFENTVIPQLGKRHSGRAGRDTAGGTRPG